MKSTQAQTAAAIKQELHRHYPTIRFTVKSDPYSVTARWMDGPTAHNVEEIMNPYTHGSFDGMTDCYNYAESAKSASVNYVFAERDYSDKARNDMRAQLTTKYRLEATNDRDPLTTRWDGMWTVGELIEHELQDVDFTEADETTRGIEESTAQNEDATTREIAESDHADAMREADEISEDDLEAAAAFLDKYEHTKQQTT